MQDNRIRYSLAGAMLALGAPSGWYLLSLALGGQETSVSLYLYLWLSTTFVFSGFGYYVGHLLEKVGRLADADRLTGLLNQAAFKNVANTLHSYCQREKLEQSVVMLDIDHFKQVNDHANHIFGSYVIQEIGKLLASQCRHSDVLARFGGDEFIIFLPSTGSKEATNLCERIRDRIHQQVFRQGRHQTTVTLSFGIASSKNDNLAVLIEKADTALYAAKANGRDRCSIFGDNESGNVAGKGAS